MPAETNSTFELDPRLENDTIFVAALPVCDVRLMNDARYLWLVLVPRLDGAVEMVDLDASVRRSIWDEVDAMAQILRQHGPCDKLNIGTLGNVVKQLHLHVVARQISDAAWPGPVWGAGTPQPYPPTKAALLVASLSETIKKRLDGDDR